jgi:hypothetical protein
VSSAACPLHSSFFVRQQSPALQTLPSGLSVTTIAGTFQNKFLFPARLALGLPWASHNVTASADQPTPK